MMYALFIPALLQIVSTCYITIDGSKGSNTSECLQGSTACKSLEYVANYGNFSANLTLEIVSEFLSVKSIALFTGINGITITGQGAENTTVRCDSNGGNSNTGLVFNNSTIEWYCC